MQKESKIEDACNKRQRGYASLEKDFKGLEEKATTKDDHLFVRYHRKVLKKYIKEHETEHTADCYMNFRKFWDQHRKNFKADDVQSFFNKITNTGATGKTSAAPSHPTGAPSNSKKRKNPADANTASADRFKRTRNGKEYS